MRQRQRTPINLPFKNFQLRLQLSHAWIVIIVSILLTLLLILLGAGSILNLAFPVGSCVVGIFLYFHCPIFYVGFTWWIWFLTPLVRRLSDYQSGFHVLSPILLAPLLVTLVSAKTLQRRISKSVISDILPFLLSIAGIIYAFLVGLIYRQPQTVTIAFLEYLCPILFGIHLYVNWRDYPRYRQNLQQVFIWGVVIMGVYGVIQYLVAPPWDGFWMERADMVSIGKPVPLGIRVWSTLNSPRPFGIIMQIGLLFLLTTSKSIRIPATISGYLSLLLSLSRAAWGSHIVSLMVLSFSLKSKFQIRLLITIVCILLGLLPLLTIEPFASRIGERLSTLSSLDSDGSAEARRNTYDTVLNQALTSIFGQGLGGKSYDSGILSTLFDMGWFGIAFYVSGVLLLVLIILKSPWCAIDHTLAAGRAVIIGFIALLPLGEFFSGIQGFTFWAFLGISMASIKYHRNKVRQLQSG